jgi:ATP-dependent DNA helicase RecG
VRGELSDIQALNEGDEVTILAEVFSASTRRFAARKGNMLEVIVTDGTSKLSLTFFNQAWREKELKVGKQGLFAGKVGVFNGKRQLAHPDYELIADGNDVDAAVEGFAGKYLPMYPASAKLPSWKISQCIELCIGALDDVPDPIPRHILDKHQYPTLQQALVQIHQPADLDIAERARERLTFDEAFILQLLLVIRKEKMKSLDAIARVKREGGILSAFDQLLPFQLTSGQVAVAAEMILEWHVAINDNVAIA